MLLEYLHARLIGLIYDERGADLAEYALILALVVIVAIAVLGSLGSRISSTLQTVVNSLQ